MNYYKVKPEYDQKPRIKNHTLKIKRVQDGVYIANELYTAGELDKFFYPIEKEYEMFEHVVIPKNKVYWSFGCRFAMEEAEENKKKNIYANENFIDDKEKMRDFYELTKEEFLMSYSYLTEEEYDNTAKLAANK